MKRKSFVAVLTSLIMSLTIFTLTGCGSDGNESTETPESTAE